jgi:hypothetical protein
MMAYRCHGEMPSLFGEPEVQVPCSRLRLEMTHVLTYARDLGGTRARLDVMPMLNHCGTARCMCRPLPNKQGETDALDR